MRIVGVIVVLSSFLLVGCTTAQKGAGIGAVLGGGVGYAIGHQSGHGGEGAAIGAGVGAVTGALVGEHMDNMYCPVCGRRFTSAHEYCPYDGTKLKPIDR